MKDAAATSKDRINTLDHYAVLGVARTATSDEVRASYKRLARQWHPDRHPEAGIDQKKQLEQKLARINVAYGILGDPTKREKYDREYELVAKEYSHIDNILTSVDDELDTPAYAVLGSGIDFSTFRGGCPMINAGTIGCSGNLFSLSYTDAKGTYWEDVVCLTGTELLAKLASKLHFERCIFENSSDIRPVIGSQSIHGYTFVSTVLLSKRLRWSCTAATWQALQACHGAPPDNSSVTPGSNWEERKEPLSLESAVASDLREGGVLSQSLPGYEERPAQIGMARAVAHALEASEHLVTEASTGTGKSLAYLLAIVRSGKVALISTANKNLQEQLFYKDIPFVQRHVQPFKAALVKGMGNYLCLDHLAEEEAFQKLVGHPSFTRMEELMADPSAWDGDFDLLEHSLPTDTRIRLAADSDSCAWRACPHFGDCYVRKMRDRSRDAQVIVVNHTLLLLDAAMDGWLLPERDVIVIDEAHHLEEEATRAFTVTVTPSRVASLLSQRRLREHAAPGALEEATEVDVRCWNALERVLRPDAKGRQNLTQPLEEGLRLASAVDDLADSLVRNRPANMSDKDEQLYEKLVKRTRHLAADLRVAFAVKSPDERVYYVEMTGGTGRRAPQLSVSAAPLSVTELLREKLFDKIPTIATSATLAVGGDFAFFRKRVGLAAARELVLPLSFEYEKNALLYVPRMRLEPAYGAASGPYLVELAEQMRQLVDAAGGRAFLLFSSRAALSAVHEHLADWMDDEGYYQIMQGSEYGRAEMLRRFRERERAVLFGLKSFWEGVDVAGEALSLVVIDKLPFDPPDDPVNEARVTKMKEAGVNWFGEYTLPLAILRLKQGIGRLLRTSDDRGVMAILDKRLHTKGYGRQVLAALPPAQRTIEISDVRAFFAR